jgi:3-hydroxyisobutyrate dehydrogenase
MKLLHNTLVAQIQNGVNEMLVMAQAAGLDFDAVTKSIKAGGGQNFYLDTKAETIKTQDFTPKFSFQNMHKDIHLTIDLAVQLGLTFPGAMNVQEIYDAGIEELKNEDFAASIKVVQKISRKKT